MKRNLTKNLGKQNAAPNFKLLIGVIGSVFTLLIEALIEKFFEISIARHIEEDAGGYIALFVLAFIVIVSVTIAVQWVKNRLRNYDDLRVPPGNHLEKLAGDRKGQHTYSNQ